MVSPNTVPSAHPPPSRFPRFDPKHFRREDLDSELLLDPDSAKIIAPPYVAEPCTSKICSDREKINTDAALRPRSVTAPDLSGVAHFMPPIINDDVPSASSEDSKKSHDTRGLCAPMVLRKNYPSRALQIASPKNKNLLCAAYIRGTSVYMNALPAYLHRCP
eukprot:CAMPEP_0174896688 /NCGR_PEP_ID=MMETSP0167-20121228/10815_1 /TAXON_ID=38298 /ORGANISM="Rhodella maculata, Strain CCMP736" /LENGTH=161 /DNA_ID=CAMNT_0016136313 /DNA_START=216 /DNA_END=700 /DNA_ORIENTATION=+